MNLTARDAHASDGFALPRPVKTLVCLDHELICLGYEEALRRGWDANYGTDPNTTSYYLQVFDCSLSEFVAILQAVEETKNHAQQDLTAQPVLPFEVGCVA